MKIMQEETFGPVLPVMMVDSAEEAIALANQSIYGLTASVWSSNIKKAKMVADKLETGTVFINDSLYSHALPELPWGGVKKSGFRRSHSQFGLLDLVNIKQISIDTSWLHRLWWYPYGPAKLKAASAGLFFLHDQQRARRLFKLWGFISNAVKSKHS
jgi:succinate-semialdehyde dehydrogenase/glutarate-semialdehyde dehydrogenase